MINVNVGCVKTSHFEMDYFSFGEGSRVFVLIPGLSLLPVTPMAKAVAMQYRAFHKEFKMYVFDRKRSISSGYTIEQMAQDTVTAMRAVGITRACIMGCSQGGMIAQCIAASEPAMVEKLVLCSTTARSNDFSRQSIGRWIELAKAGDVVALNQDVFSRVYSQAYYDKYSQSFKVAELLGTDEDLKHFIPLAQACEGFDSRQLLSFIKCPVMVVGSNIDNVLTGEGSRELASILKCDLLMYDNYGHAAYDEAPDLHERILAFVGV